MPVGYARQLLHLLDGAGGEKDVRRREDRGPVIHGGLDPVQRHFDAVGALDHDDLQTRALPREKRVAQRREIQLRHGTAQGGPDLFELAEPELVPSAGAQIVPVAFELAPVRDGAA